MVVENICALPLVLVIFTWLKVRFPGIVTVPPEVFKKFAILELPSVQAALGVAVAVGVVKLVAEVFQVPLNAVLLEPFQKKLTAEDDANIVKLSIPK